MNGFGVELGCRLNVFGVELKNAGAGVGDGGDVGGGVGGS